MITNINEELTRVKENVRLQQKWSNHLDRTKRNLVKKQEELTAYQKTIEKNSHAVKKLEGISPQSVLLAVFGKRLEKLEREKEELVKATLIYEETKETVEDLQIEVLEYERLLETIGETENKYAHLLTEKEKLIHDSNSPWSSVLFELAEEEAEVLGKVKESEEAIEAGKRAIQSLDIAIDELDKAKGWSTWDMVGGGVLTTAIKHNHIELAKKAIHHAQKRLRQFHEELLDVNENSHHSEIEISGLLTFADYFFDGLLVDWTVHGKIKESLDQVYKTKQETVTVLNHMKQVRKKSKMKYEQIKANRIRLLEDAK
ncbi:hypothetical protein [Bacillus alkalicellulosilyticus]|uniref:hypothetical protein n=1 Tax=Alkalihalobacterium alkalicellulosilyticum TaxID=1912214 RepID=UPI0009976CDA|nr:hypothetical protein [Bacillus alkalicellulosilyticus]